MLKEVIEKCVPGASTVAVCEFSDNRVLEETAKIFKKEKNLKTGTQLLKFSNSTYFI